MVHCMVHCMVHYIVRYTVHYMAHHIVHHIVHCILQYIVHLCRANVPGVATSISAPPARTSSCGRAVAPPYAHALQCAAPEGGRGASNVSFAHLVEQGIQ